MNQRRNGMVAGGLVLASGIGVLQLTDWALAAGLAVVVAMVGLVIVAWGMRPSALRVDTASTKEGSAMDENLERQEWEPIGSTGHFYRIAMPMSGEARRLNGGGFRQVLYAEFDTADEGAAWKEFVYDPLKVLIAEGILPESPEGDARVHVTIYKLTGEPATDEEYLTAVRDRGQQAAELYSHVAIAASTRSTWHVGTTIVNHEQPLNPRIGMASIVM